MTKSLTKLGTDSLRQWKTTWHEHDQAHLSWWSVDIVGLDFPVFHVDDVECAESLAAYLNDLEIKADSPRLQEV